MTTMATRAATTTVVAAGRTPFGPHVTLYAEAFALTTDRFPEIAELRFHHVGDSLASGVERVTDLVAYRVDRHAIPDLLAAFCGPAGAGSPTLSGPLGGGDGTAGRGPRHRRDGSPPGRPAAHQQRRARADHRAEDGRGQ